MTIEKDMYTKLQAAIAACGILNKGKATNEAAQQCEWPKEHLVGQQDKCRSSNIYQ